MSGLDTVSTTTVMTSSPESERATLATVSSCATLASEHGFTEDFLSHHGHMLSATENIPAFYKNASIFITGATGEQIDTSGFNTLLLQKTNKDFTFDSLSGFLGKSILEKLLRSCPDVDKIFVLVRSKKGHCPSERVEALFNSKVSNMCYLNPSLVPSPTPITPPP